MKIHEYSNVKIIDPQLDPEFISATNDSLAYPFISDISGNIMVAIPKEYSTGSGKGYLFDVLSHINGGEEGFAVLLPCSHYGVPVDELIMFLCNFNFLKQSKRMKARTIPKTKVGFIRHNSAITMNRLKGDLDLISQGFRLSAGHTFSSRSGWREDTPIVQDSKSGKGRLLTTKESIELFGNTNPKDSIPLLMLNNISKLIK